MDYSLISPSYTTVFDEARFFFFFFSSEALRSDSPQTPSQTKGTGAGVPFVGLSVLLLRAEAASYAAAACAGRFGSESHGRAVNHKTSDGFL